MSELNDFEALREDSIKIRAENRQLIEELERLRARAEDAEMLAERRKWGAQEMDRLRARVEKLEAINEEQDTGNEVITASHSSKRSQNVRSADEIERLRSELADAQQDATQLRGENNLLHRRWQNSRVELGELRARIEELEAEMDKLNQIVMAVSRKYPKEKRWETALRYVREMESFFDNAQGQAANRPRLVEKDNG